jgi:hypothetical protein
VDNASTQSLDLFERRLHVANGEIGQRDGVAGAGATLVDPDIGIPRSCPPAAALGLPPRGELWVLRELLHYLSGEASGAVGFEDMGENWVGVRKAARDGTLRAGDVAVRDVAERWEQFTNYLSLSLSQELGAKGDCRSTQIADNHRAVG